MLKNEAMVPTNDYVFKRIFGKVGNEEITRGLISAVIGEEVKSVELNESTILEKDLIDDKIGILDVRARLDNGTICNVEMQVVQSKDIEKGLMFYWSKLYSSEIKEGEDYNKLKKTIVILIADFELESIKEIEKYHTRWQIREEEYTKSILTDVLEISIISLEKLIKQLKEKDIDKKDKLILWSLFIKNPERIGEKEMVENSDIKKAKEELDKIKEDEREQYLAELRLKHIRDSHAIEAYGYDKGREEKQEEVILNMYKEKIDIETIARVVNLEKEEVETIIEKNNKIFVSKKEGK